MYLGMKILRLKMDYFDVKLFRTLSLCILLIGLSLANEGSIFYQVNYNTSNITLIPLDVECPIEEFTQMNVSNTTEDQQNSIDQLSTQISNGKDVENLLDYVKWRMFIYSCAETSGDFSFSEYELQDGYINSFCSFTDTIDYLFRFRLHCGDDINCSSFLNSSLLTQWYLFLVLGLLYFVGNILVIYDKIVSFQKFQNKHKEIQIYNALVLNLSLADLLMGLYLTAILFEIRYKVDNGV